MQTDNTGQFAIMYKPFHLIAFKLFISVLSVALRNEPTGQSREMLGTVASVAKRNLKAVEKLDGKCGFTVCSKALPLKGTKDARPIGLAHDVIPQWDLPEGAILHMDDINLVNDRANSMYHEDISI